MFHNIPRLLAVHGPSFEAVMAQTLIVRTVAVQGLGLWLCVGPCGSMCISWWIRMGPYVSMFIFV